jgi:hypothetical protein
MSVIEKIYKILHNQEKDFRSIKLEIKDAAEQAEKLQRQEIYNAKKLFRESKTLKHLRHVNSKFLKGKGKISYKFKTEDMIEENYHPHGGGDQGGYEVKLLGQKRVASVVLSWNHRNTKKSVSVSDEEVNFIFQNSLYINPASQDILKENIAAKFVNAINYP